MSAAPGSSVARDDESLDAVLRPSHAVWLEAAHCFLEPALEPAADVWTRWAAVRYLADDFRDRCGWESGLLDELRPFLSPAVSARLLEAGDRLFRRRLELDRIGRRRGTAAEFAAGTRELLEQLGGWCGEIERAAAGITRAALPAEGAALLGHLEASLPHHR
jgi:hypothetical protein